ncbi:hypothetical protein [Paraburkholderia terricola]|uniref:Pectate lyase superfamily protein n=1 Tax=Paraburkholderia terricola TaxID=169427 RepID=A0ABU1LK43_9BURK|nr:hypothetical protein [Paraburkholderia terricola]MDR6407096.1 hypothetical protein [Paraburkholderia terricola]MDR6479226.1 hypothetical protein [Paraburkholderia terricola]
MNRRSAMGLSAGIAVLGAAAASPERGEPQADQFPNGFRWLHHFAAKGKGTSDDTGTFQRAIDFLRNIALRTRDTSCVPALLIPSGRYILTDTIHTMPWIKLCSVGGVLLDFSQLPVARDGLTCRNETALPATDLRFPGDRSPFLDGAGGTISIRGPGVMRAEGWGITMGNRHAGFSGIVRDAGGCNVVVTGWRGALRIDPVNTYLCAWFSSRFEQNREQGIFVAPSDGRSVNSGERMTFVDCTLSGSARAIDINSDSMDFVFDACSFDFNGDIVHFGKQARFGTVAFNHCHIEGIDGLLVDAKASGKHLRTVFRDSIVLPRRWKRKELNNAPRQLVAGTAKFSASGLEWRFESPEQGTLTALIGDEVPVESMTATSFQRIRALPWRGSVINADSLFALNSPGTSAGALTHWTTTCAASAKHIGEIVVVDASARSSVFAKPRQALRLAFPAHGNASISVATRTPFPVTPGELVMAGCSATAMGATGRVKFTFQFDAAEGIPLSASESQGVANELPSAQAAVPPGANRAVLMATFVGWTGTLQINELAVWRSS